MREADEEALRRYTLIRTFHLIAAGTRHCRGCGAETECFVKRKALSRDTKPRCLDCWKLER
jgi:hypothetical protein